MYFVIYENVIYRFAQGLCLKVTGQFVRWRKNMTDQNSEYNIYNNLTNTFPYFVRSLNKNITYCALFRHSSTHKKDWNIFNGKTKAWILWDGRRCWTISVAFLCRKISCLSWNKYVPDWMASLYRCAHGSNHVVWDCIIVRRHFICVFDGKDFISCSF